MRSDPIKGDIRCGSQGLANAEAARSGPYGVPWQLPFGADYESWPKPNGHWTDVANSYLDLPHGATTVDGAAMGDAAQRD